MTPYWHRDGHVQSKARTYPTVHVNRSVVPRMRSQVWRHKKQCATGSWLQPDPIWSVNSACVIEWVTPWLPGLRQIVPPSFRWKEHWKHQDTFGRTPTKQEEAAKYMSGVTPTRLRLARQYDVRFVVSSHKITVKMLSGQKNTGTDLSHINENCRSMKRSRATSRVRSLNGEYKPNFREPSLSSKRRFTPRATTWRDW